MNISYKESKAKAKAISLNIWLCCTVNLFLQNLPWCQTKCLQPTEQQSLTTSIFEAWQNLLSTGGQPSLQSLVQLIHFSKTLKMKHGADGFCRFCPSLLLLCWPMCSKCSTTGPCIIYQSHLNNINGSLLKVCSLLTHHELELVIPGASEMPRELFLKLHPLLTINFKKMVAEIIAIDWLNGLQMPLVPDGIKR